ncbi:hypothetical protein AMAG_20192 [Allomyces macrogynus ATCC 38327]|uniref:Uncharacterized protein n=1 Tax=Allomyces macrogynus (strain ATCC 38327) TaxID=578462 RepID=A0A0L0T7S6_ALLM3|nr:hypothetical protein AMAG_20192 [Allomyces macrogynus ATCC 38327]|eukprot:KNE70863.1 hypothetical protein AMAG_20192 [Allomyces macrogynus ATCC 38327]
MTAAAAATAASTAARRLVIGGVPEHFNVPLMRAIDQGVFARHGLDVSFKSSLAAAGATGTVVGMVAAASASGFIATKLLARGMIGT